MERIRTALAAVLASLILTVLGRMGVREVAPEVETWVGHTVELLLVLAHAALPPRPKGEAKAADP